PEWLQSLEAFNPMYNFLTYAREILLMGSTPSLALNLVCAGTAIVSLLIGWSVFKRTERKFILYI
ncbi:MAG: ABC transporter permease, partial [Atopobiaceae bacterium]|nr:ABC transporter permease [Atopobiaceae bacterium]